MVCRGLKPRAEQHLDGLHLRDQVALVVPGAAAPDEAVLDLAGERRRPASALSVPGAIGTTSWCAISAIGLAVGVAAVPGVEQAVARRPPRACSVGVHLREALLQVGMQLAELVRVRPRVVEAGHGLRSGSRRPACRPRACSSTASGGAGGTSSCREPWRQRVDGHGRRQQQHQASKAKGDALDHRRCGPSRPASAEALAFGRPASGSAAPAPRTWRRRAGSSGSASSPAPR